MLRQLLLVLFVCLALFGTPHNTYAKLKRPDTADNGIKAIKKNAKSNTAISSKKRSQTADSSASTHSAKRSFLHKRQVIIAAKSKAALRRHATRVERDPATLPPTEEFYDEAPDTVLTALSSIPTDGEISSYFGIRSLSRRAKHGRMHTGVDITAVRGTPVHAAAEGVVSFLGRWNAYGRIVEIDHGHGLVTRYAHLDSFTVSEGSRVRSGQQIGTIGRSGRTTGAHLHFETLVNGKAVDPMKAEMWHQTPDQLATKRDLYMSGIHHATAKHS